MRQSLDIVADSPPERRPRLLIVDDIPESRMVLALRFARSGFEIVEADGGAAALELIEHQSFDAMLLDVIMPEIDGIEVLRRTRARFSPIQLPVIMVTAEAGSDSIVGALELEANDYITKPVDFAVALARVNAQLDRTRAEATAQKANEALHLVNETLEERILERTRRLAEINDQLKGEIEQRLRQEAQSRYLAYHDPLTGLGNRRLFREELEQALADARASVRPLAVLFIDLDGFKRINDALGHSVGDLLLKAVADDLRHVLKVTDRIARLGGDEFAILQTGEVQPQGAIGLAGRIVDIAGRQRTVSGHQITAGASVGIVISRDGEDEPEQVLKNADLAMDRAKADGRGAYRMFDAVMDEKAQMRRSLELEMRAAIARGQFDVHYQPQISLRTGKVAGFEALVRWDHPTRGPVSPATFIPIAEEIGLIVPLGEWVLHEACREAADWPDTVRIAVNVSSIQFTRGDIAGTVVEALAASGLPARRLELEITESVLLEHTDRNLETLNRLRSLGVRISMDDFGTGYASLAYLRRFQFDKIKIDQSFVRDLAHDHESGAIVHAIAGLGASFGIPTTAEGVETSEQLERLASEGCTEVQGRIFGMPAPSGDVADILARFGA